MPVFTVAPLVLFIHKWVRIHLRHIWKGTAASVTTVGQQSFLQTESVTLQDGPHHLKWSACCVEHTTGCPGDIGQFEFYNFCWFCGWTVRDDMLIPQRNVKLYDPGSGLKWCRRALFSQKQLGKQKCRTKKAICSGRAVVMAALCGSGINKANMMQFSFLPFLLLSDLLGRCVVH